MTLRLQNTLTRKKEPFRAREEGHLPREALDLALPGAWEATVRRVRRMTRDEAAGRLEPAGAARAIRSLEKIDRILGVLFD